MKIITKLSVLAISFIFASPAFAQQDQDAINALINYASVGGLVISVGIVVGFATVLSGIIHFKNSAHDRLSYPIGEGVSRLLTGVAMLSFVGVYIVIKTSFFTGGDDSWIMQTGNDVIALSNTVQEGYRSETVGSAILTKELKAIAAGILWVIGLFFMFSGIYKFKMAGAAGSKSDGSVKGGVLQLMASVALMNPTTTACLVMAFGPSAFACSS